MYYREFYNFVYAGVVSRPILITLLIVILALLTIENVNSYVADFVADFNRSNSGIALFVLISITFTVGQFVILKFVGQRIQAIISRSRLVRFLQVGLPIIQYLLVANIILIIIGILFFSEYLVTSLFFVTIVANLTAAFFANSIRDTFSCVVSECES